MYLGLRVAVALDAGARCEGLKGGVFEEVDAGVGAAGGSAAVLEGSRIGAPLLAVIVVATGGSSVAGEDGVDVAIAAEEVVAALVPEPSVAVPRVTRSATPIPITITATDAEAVRIQDRKEERESRRSGMGGVLCSPEMGDGEGE